MTPARPETILRPHLGLYRTLKKGRATPLIFWSRALLDQLLGCRAAMISPRLCSNIAI